MRHLHFVVAIDDQSLLLQPHFLCFVFFHFKGESQSQRPKVLLKTTAMTITLRIRTQTPPEIRLIERRIGRKCLQGRTSVLYMHVYKTIISLVVLGTLHRKQTKNKGISMAFWNVKGNIEEHVQLYQIWAICLYVALRHLFLFSCDYVCATLRLCVYL